MEKQNKNQKCQTNIRSYQREINGSVTRIYK